MTLKGEDKLSPHALLDFRRFTAGSSFVCTYRFRHPLGSSEMFHDRVVGTDGATLSRGGEEFVRAIRDIRLLRANFDPERIKLFGQDRTLPPHHEAIA